MTSERRLFVAVLAWSLVAWGLTATLGVFALGASTQTDAPAPKPATVIEQAVIERRCVSTRPAGAPETAAYQECLSTQLLSLRTDFGLNLARLSESERKNIDTACSSARESRGRDGYVDCLSGQLVTLHNRRPRKAPEAPPAAAIAAPPVVAASVTPAPVAQAVASSSFSLVWIGSALAIAIVAGGGALLAMRSRRARPTCRSCGGEVTGAGDLCQKCRHEAAEALRQAAAQRAEAQRAEADKERRQREHEEEQRLQKIRQREEDDARIQRERAQREDEARGEEEARQREEEARRQNEMAEASGGVLDPYAILGVTPDASPDAISAAYQQAKLKYAPDMVAHLGTDIQEHFRAKASAVEMAYQQLTK
jgi:hypothetical protein